MKSEFKPERIQRLLIRATNWIGDCVMMLPALKEIRQSFRQSHITVLALPWVSDLYENNPWVDEVLIYDRQKEHAGIRGWVRLIRMLRARSFDAALLLQNAFEAALIARLAGIPLRAGYRRDGRGLLLTHAIRINPQVRQLHQTYYYLDLVDQLLTGEGEPALVETTVSLPDISFPVQETVRDKARQRLNDEGITFRRRLVGVNPGAFYGGAKRWLSDRYAAVLDRLIKEQDVDVVIFGAPNEVSIAESIKSLMTYRPFVLSGRTRLMEFIGMIACCDLFITNDSGPMHLAAALRVKTLAIFGPTDQTATGPLSPNAVVLNKRVECSPCLLRECPIDHRCMTRISADEVYWQVVEMLSAQDGF